jgi:hypothetical protein
MAKVKVGEVYEDGYMRATILRIDDNSIHCEVFYRDTHRTRSRDLEEKRLLQMSKIKG